MKRISIAVGLLLFIVFSFNSSYGQRFHRKQGWWAANAGIGVLSFWGDIQTNPVPTAINPGVHLGIGRIFKNGWMLRANILYGGLSGSKTNRREGIIRSKESFSTPLFEFSVQQSITFYKLKIRRNSFVRSREHSVIPLYGFFGIGVFRTNPEASIDRANSPVNFPNPEIKKPGASMDICFPFGLGARYYLTKKILIGAEFGWRLTLSDQVDARVGRTSENDMYSYLSANLTYLLSKPSRGMECPRWW